MTKKDYSKRMGSYGACTPGARIGKKKKSVPRKRKGKESQDGQRRSEEGNKFRRPEPKSDQERSALFAELDRAKPPVKGGRVCREGTDDAEMRGGKSHDLDVAKGGKPCNDAKGVKTEKV